MGHTHSPAHINLRFLIFTSHHIDCVCVCVCLRWAHTLSFHAKYCAWCASPLRCMCIFLVFRSLSLFLHSPERGSQDCKVSIYRASHTHSTKACMEENCNTSWGRLVSSSAIFIFISCHICNWFTFHSLSLLHFSFNQMTFRCESHACVYVCECMQLVKSNESSNN